MNITINKIEYHLPDNLVKNEDFQKMNPLWEMEKASEKTGVYQRFIASENETAFDLSCKACDKLFQDGDIRRDQIGGIIFCTQSPDYILPSNAFLLHQYLNLTHAAFAFDYNLACSGFIYGLAIARGFIATGLASNILLINGDTYSKFINPRDRSTRTLFGDGAAATVISRQETPGIIDIMLASSGKDYESFYIPSGGFRSPKSDLTKIDDIDASGNARNGEEIHMNGFGIWKFVASTVPVQINEILKRNNYSVNDIDLYIFHQASKMTIDSLAKALKIDESKVFSNIRNIGNLVSASIPVAIKDAEKEGRLKRGHLILLSGFGVGLSWGTVIMRF